MSILPVAVNILLFAVLGYGLYHYFTSGKTSAPPVPPGPRRLPLVGNLLDLPKPGVPEWQHWLQHKDLYGPISSINVLGNTIIILNDAKLAVELLEKRSNVTSARPKMVFAGEMCGWDNLMVLNESPDKWRSMRKQFHAAIGSQSALSSFMEVQEIEVERFLLRVLDNPAELLQHIRTEAGAIILKIGYDYTIEPHKRDPLVDIAEQALEEFSAATVPGSWLVDTIPALKYVPEWFIPGGGFKKTARQFRKTVMNLANCSMRFAKHQMAKPEHRPSFISAIYEKTAQPMSEAEEEETKWSAAALYAGGSDTTVCTMESFFLAMSVNPEVQRKAQEEIDRVIGKERLPDYGDRSKLPYVSAVVSEAFRWHAIAPMCIPHVATADETCGGYAIPKGAMLLPNIWYFTQDPAVHSQPSAFKPERFLGAHPEPDPRNYVFGFGRRVCPGRLLADSSVWLTIAKSLAVFDIGKGVDAYGREIQQQVQFRAGTVSHPHPFKTTIIPRSPGHVNLIRTVEERHPWEAGDADVLEAFTD